METGYAEKAYAGGAMLGGRDLGNAVPQMQSVTAQAIQTLDSVVDTAALLANFAEQILGDACVLRGRLTGDYPPPTSQGGVGETPRQPLLLELAYHQKRLHSTLERLQSVGQQIQGALG